MGADNKGRFWILNVILFLLISTGLVQAETSWPFTYEIDGTTVKITACDVSASEALEVPAEIDGRSVTALDIYAFWNCYSLTSVTLPASILTIDDWAFLFNSIESIIVAEENPNYASVDGVLFNDGLTTLIQCPGGKTDAYIIPEGVMSINRYAFYKCDSLKGLTLSSTVSSFSEWTFSYCDSLETIAVAEESLHFSSVDGVLFDKSLKTLIRFPGGKPGAFTLPESTATIDDYAFYSCHLLTNVVIHANVAAIGDSAFRGCSSLASITVAEANHAFASDDGILLSGNLTTVIVCPAGKTGECILPEGVVYIADYAFWDCDGLTKITLPESLTTIGYGAFWYCDGLTVIAIPNQVMVIESSAFRSCSALSVIIFMGEAPGTMGDNVFDSNADIRYYDGNEVGFGSPDWDEYSPEVVSNTFPVIFWLNNFGYSIDTEIGQQDQNGDGVALLTAYALNLNPHEDLSESLPKAEVGSGTVGIRFYAAAEGVEYIAETSVNLTSWSTGDGLSISSLDSENYRTASVSTDSSCRFIRLRFSFGD